MTCTATVTIDNVSYQCRKTRPHRDHDAYVLLASGQAGVFLWSDTRAVLV